MAVVAEVELVGMHRAGLPLRLRDSPVPPTETRSWAEYLWPAGFRKCLVVGLHTPDGRHLGVLALHTDTVDQVLAAPEVDALLTDVQIGVDLRHPTPGRDQVQDLATKLRRVNLWAWSGSSELLG